MNNHQRNPDSVFANCDPSFFSLTVLFVEQRKHKSIEENFGCSFEANLVFAIIQFCLSGIPLKIVLHFGSLPLP